jgi:hypothetical protein
LVTATGGPSNSASAPPVLNTAPESDALSLAANSATNTPSASAASATTAPSPPQTSGGAPTPGESRQIDLASGTLGLSDNLLLGALVAVFALAVIALVSAGGHRGSWRQH